MLDDMRNYKNEIREFAKQLGVLPIYLLHQQDESEGKYALLNGLTNNFSIDYENNLDINIYRDYAWSSNTNSFLSINQDNSKAFLYRFDKRNFEEIRYRSILDNLQKFYDYLGTQNKQNRENTIVPYILRVYRKLRNEIRTENGGDSLNAFLYLLATLEHENVEIDKWGLSGNARNIVNSINPIIWSEISEELNTGLIFSGYKLTPQISLILRHTAGKLFEEANFIAHYSSQLELFPSEIIKYDYSPKQYGAYFTPPYIARTIVEESLLLKETLPNNIKIFDPACGAGEFLVESLRQLKYRGYKGNISIIGWDIADTALDMARFVLTYEKREWGNQLNIELCKKDSLSNQWPTNIDFIFMNPPFMSWEEMRKAPIIREQIANMIGEKAGKPNLAAIFYLLASRNIGCDGIIGCLIPSSVLNSDSHQGIRKETQETIKPHLIGRLGCYVFENALVDTCLIIASKESYDNETKILWADNDINVTPKALRELRKQQHNTAKVINSPDFSIYSVPEGNYLSQNSWMPVSFSSISVKYKLEKSIMTGRLLKIKDMFHVKQGARTGGNKIFIISSDIYDLYSEEEKKYFRPSVDSSAIKKGFLRNNNYVFFPNTEGLKPIENEEDLKLLIPNYYQNVLLPNKDKLLHRARVKPDNWWRLSEHRAWQTEKEPKLVSTEFGSAGNFAYDKSGEYIVERGCAWFPKNDISFISEYNYAYIAVLNSSVMNILLSVYSKPLLAKNRYSLDSKNISNVPIPNLWTLNFEESSILIDFGKRMAKGLNYNEDELDSLVYKIYDIEI